MSCSIFYTDLSNRINRLEQNLLPPIDPLLQYSDKDIDLTNAFYLLCHVEIEVYIENIVRKVVEDAFNKWNNDKEIISPIIFHLALNYKQGINKPREHPYSMIYITYKELIKDIDKNNGIKEQNIDNLLRPIGFVMDPTLKTTLSNYGNVRGRIAHHSYDPQNPSDPAIAKGNTQQILHGLSVFDTEITQYELTGTTNRLPIYLNLRKRFFLYEWIRKLFKRQ